MEKENIFIMISGPAACGKSTLVNGISTSMSAHIYQPSRAFIELASIRKIPTERAFYDISREEAEDHFCQKFKENNIIVGDQHLAIQHNKDSRIASSNSNTIFLDEPYVSAIDYELFRKLSENKIKTLLIYLKTSPEILYERAYKRFLEQGTFIRNKNLKEVIEEVNAEDYYFNQLINKVAIESHIIDTDNKGASEVLDNALRKTLKFRK